MHALYSTRVMRGVLFPMLRSGPLRNDLSLPFVLDVLRRIDATVHRQRTTTGKSTVTLSRADKAAIEALKTWLQVVETYPVGRAKESMDMWTRKRAADHVKGLVADDRKGRTDKNPYFCPGAVMCAFVQVAGTLYDKAHTCVFQVAHVHAAKGLCELSLVPARNKFDLVPVYSRPRQPQHPRVQAVYVQPSGGSIKFGDLDDQKHAQQFDGTRYRLTCVVLHVDNGHFVAAVRNEDASGGWVLVDDSRVVASTDDSLAAFAGQWEYSTVVISGLMYERA